jgi:hypothetical protein
MYVRRKSCETPHSKSRSVTAITPRLREYDYVMRSRAFGAFDAMRILRETSLRASGILAPT